MLSLRPVGPGGEALAEPALERRSAAPGQVKNSRPPARRVPAKSWQALGKVGRLSAHP